MIHVDVMDGHFVPNISIGIPVVASLRKATRLPLDVHLMIEQPEEYIEEFVRAGARPRPGASGGDAASGSGPGDDSRVGRAGRRGDQSGHAGGDALRGAR